MAHVSVGAARHHVVVGLHLDAVLKEPAERGDGPGAQRDPHGDQGDPCHGWPQATPRPQQGVPTELNRGDDRRCETAGEDHGTGIARGFASRARALSQPHDEFEQCPDADRHREHDRRGVLFEDKRLRHARLVFTLAPVLGVANHNFRRVGMSTTATGIRQINLVCVSTPDQDRAIEFYESIGFEKRTDVPFGGKYRWVEVYPPEGSAGIALAPPPPGEEEGAPAQTGITVTTDDIETPHAEM